MFLCISSLLSCTVKHFRSAWPVKSLEVPVISPQPCESAERRNEGTTPTDSEEMSRLPPATGKTSTCIYIQLIDAVSVLLPRCFHKAHPLIQRGVRALSSLRTAFLGRTRKRRRVEKLDEDLLQRFQEDRCKKKRGRRETQCGIKRCCMFL